jgi:aspartate carbamoyltransferase catalytic subunit
MLALGADVWVCGPPTLMPAKAESLGVKVTYNMEEAVQDADVVMMLRIQQERQNKALIPSIREYASYYCLNEKRLQLAKKDVLVLHPGPINRGVEISSKIADGLHSVIEEQVTNGVAIRMALLYLMTGGVNDATA